MSAYIEPAIPTWLRALVGRICEGLPNVEKSDFLKDLDLFTPKDTQLAVIQHTVAISRIESLHLKFADTPISDLLMACLIFHKEMKLNFIQYDINSYDPAIVAEVQRNIGMRNFAAQEVADFLLIEFQKVPYRPKPAHKEPFSNWVSQRAIFFAALAAQSCTKPLGPSCKSSVYASKSHAMASPEAQEATSKWSAAVKSANVWTSAWRDERDSLLGALRDLGAAASKEVNK